MSCPVCMKPYNTTHQEPMMTPCNHSLCLTCLIDLVTYTHPDTQVQGHQGQDQPAMEQGPPHLPKGKVVLCPYCKEQVNTDQLITNR
ncbi:putative wiskott-Aldrich syndrome protein family member 2-like [Homarus americanus]|uniref:Putative wiskott-Aldrich syndrome protein family member 2-like n=1 Tax=Homarus americanus TaxID=6706 RepID=A0A8J5N4Q7_HOMAM|nr:putative wiskott-Aldrich syndrome protein family member 2-like [Homarus americanus]